MGLPQAIGYPEALGAQRRAASEAVGAVRLHSRAE
jgi:hypothetical protein